MQEKNTLNTIENTYISIEEMPIYNWNKVFETGDLSYIFKDGKGKITQDLAELWDDIQQQWIDEFGLEQEMEERIRIKRKLAEHKLDYIITQDRFILNFITIAEIELEDLNKQKSVSFYQAKDTVEKYKGFRLDPKQITVIEWGYTLKNMAQNGSKTDKRE